MSAPTLLLWLLALGGVAPDPPITVTGHSWAPFISPMGEPFRARSAEDDTLADWFRQADSNGDGKLTLAEMQADAARFFAKLDEDHDGEIGPDELARYEWEVAPEIQAMARTRSAPGEPAQKRSSNRLAGSATSLGIGGALQGAARYGLLNMPEPVAAADSDFNRAVTLKEFEAAAAERFDLLDSRHSGTLTLDALRALLPDPREPAHRSNRDSIEADSRLGTPLPAGP